MKKFQKYLLMFIRILGSLGLIMLLFFTFCLEVFLLPDIKGEPSLVDWQTFFVLLGWIVALLLLYLWIAKSLIINLLLIPIGGLWGRMLYAQLNSGDSTIQELLLTNTGLIVCLIGFVFIIIKNREQCFKWCNKGAL